MATLGDTLRTAREQRGASCSEAAAATRIKIQHIEALEANEYSTIAAPAYAKGFIKLYAEYLDLDPKPLIAEYVKTYMPKERSPLFSEDSASSMAEASSPAGDDAPDRFKLSDLKLPKLDIPWDKLQAYAPYVAGAIAALALVLVGIRLISQAFTGDPSDRPGSAGQGHGLYMAEPPEPYIDLYESP